MYNEELKQRYLKNCRYEEVTKPVIEIIFNNSESVEISNNKDLCKFNLEEVTDFLKKINTTSRGYLTTICSYLEDYYNWCLQQDITNDIDNKFSSKNTKLIIESIIPIERLNEKYFNKTQLLEFLNKIYAPENKFILYSFFLGFKFEELINLKRSDIHKYEMTVDLNRDEPLKVDRLWMNLMENADKSEYYDEDGKLDITKKISNLNFYIQSEYILKYTLRYENNPLSAAVINNRVRTIKHQTGNEHLTIRNIQINGLVNYIKDKYYEKGITLETALTRKFYTKDSTYNKETEKYIKEFGLNITARSLKAEIIKHLDCFK